MMIVRKKYTMVISTLKKGLPLNEKNTVKLVEELMCVQNVLHYRGKINLFQVVPIDVW